MMTKTLQKVKRNIPITMWNQCLKDFSCLSNISDLQNLKFHSLCTNLMKPLPRQIYYIIVTSLFMSVCLSVCPTVRLSICLFVYPSVCPSAHPSVCPSMHPLACLYSICVSISSSGQPSISNSTRQISFLRQLPSYILHYSSIPFSIHHITNTWNNINPNHEYTSKYHNFLSSVQTHQ